MTPDLFFLFAPQAWGGEQGSGFWEADQPGLSV